MRITIDIDHETAKLLGALADPVHSGIHDRAQSVLRHLAHSAADGVRRPGSWERSWVEQCFGSDFTQQLEHDPVTPWYMRPKGEP